MMAKIDGYSMLLKLSKVTDKDVLISIDEGSEDIYGILKELNNKKIKIHEFYEDDGGEEIVRKFILQECKRVLIKKKIPLIIIFIVTIAFGLINVLKAKPLEAQLQQDKIILNNQLNAKANIETINNTKENISNIEEMLNIINNYDKSKIDEEIEKLEKESNPKNEYKISLLKYEKKHNIEKNELMPKGMSASVNLLAQKRTTIFYILVLIIMLSDIVSGEYVPNTIKMSLTKPIARQKIIISKFIVSIIISAGTIIISAIIFIVEAGIHLGFSDYRMPFPVGRKYILDKSLPLTSTTSQMKYVEGTCSLISNWGGIVEFVIITILISIVTISIIMLISTLCKNSFMSALTSFVLVIITYILFDWRLMQNFILSAKYGTFLKFFPIPYIFENFYVLNGDISIRLTSSINIFFALMVCLCWTLIMMFLSTYIFGKRDFD